jgi:hypothetical protein
MFAAIFIWIGLSWILAYRLCSQVNIKLIPPQRARVWPSWQYWRMLQLHREFYPSSWLRSAAYLCHAGCFAWFVALLFSN